MNIRILCVGKLKERYWKDAVAEYSKRLARFCRLEIVEVKESRLPDNHSPADEDRVRRNEGEMLLDKIRETEYIISLEINGDRLSSEGLADKMERLAIGGHSNIVFIIGGSLGTSDAVCRRADCKLSFSAMTFPHQMIRVILLEQIYRSFKINAGETYHK